MPKSLLDVRARIAVVFVVGLLAAAPAAQQQPVTLEALLAWPFPSEIAAAPAGGHVAWVQNAKGSRNVWAASAPEFEPRQLTTYAGDDGQDITSLTWTPDGRTVLYVRGSGPNRQGEIPNPALMPEAAEQAIWAADIGSSAPRKLATGSSPSVSSTGQVVYLARGQVWATNVAGTAKPVQRSLRRCIQDDTVSRRQHRPRRESHLVARRHAHRVHPYPFDWRELHVCAAPPGRALVDP
jgi:hypothetical protein